MTSTDTGGRHHSSRVGRVFDPVFSAVAGGIVLRIAAQLPQPVSDGGAVSRPPQPPAGFFAQFHHKRGRLPRIGRLLTQGVGVAKTFPLESTASISQPRSRKYQ